MPAERRGGRSLACERRRRAAIARMNMTRPASGPLSGLRILEIAGIGPAPFCGMLLADLGADVVIVARPQAGVEDIDIGLHEVIHRGKRSIAVDLKTAEGVETVLRMV